MSDFHGAFVWYDLMTTDLPAAEAFYKKVIGWDIRDSGMPGMAYALLAPVGAKAGEKCTDAGGMMTIPPDAAAAGARPAWTGYVAVDDVDASAEAVKKAGGKVHREPDDIPGVGRFAVVADPHGAVFNLFRGNDSDPTSVPPQGAPGHAGWRELYAGDLDSAFDFYSGLFGWKKAEAMDMGAMGVYQIFERDGVKIGGMMTRPPMIPAPFWLYYFNVDAADAAVTRITEAGGKVMMGPQEVPGPAWIVQATDPQGAMFAVVAPRR